jgi:hypothetical protein
MMAFSGVGQRLWQSSGDYRLIATVDVDGQ